jgi:hypothetical protein
MCGDRDLCAVSALSDRPSVEYRPRCRLTAMAM